MIAIMLGLTIVQSVLQLSRTDQGEPGDHMPANRARCAHLIRGISLIVPVGTLQVVPPDLTSPKSEEPRTQQSCLYAILSIAYGGFAVARWNNGNDL